MIISKNCKRVIAFRDAIFGLLLPSNPRSLLLKTRLGIHTFGLMEPIDVLILDSRNRVVKLKKSLKPNRIFLWNIKFNQVLELPKDSIKDSGIKISDLINFV